MGQQKEAFRLLQRESLRENVSIKKEFKSVDWNEPLIAVGVAVTDGMFWLSEVFVGVDWWASCVRSPWLSGADGGGVAA